MLDTRLARILQDQDDRQRRRQAVAVLTEALLHQLTIIPWRRHLVLPLTGSTHCPDNRTALADWVDRHVEDLDAPDLGAVRNQLEAFLLDRFEAWS